MSISPEGRMIELLERLVKEMQKQGEALKEMAVALKPRPRGRPKKDAAD